MNIFFSFEKNCLKFDLEPFLIKNLF